MFQSLAQNVGQASTGPICLEQFLEAIGSIGIHWGVNDHMQVRVVRGGKPVMFQLKITDERVVKPPLACGERLDGVAFPQLAEKFAGVEQATNQVGEGVIA